MKNSRSFTILLLVVLLSVGFSLPLLAQDSGAATTGDTGAPAAPATDAPAPAADSPMMELPGADKPATDTPAVVYQPKFFGADVTLDSHRASGYIIGGLYAGAAVVGFLRYNDLTAGAATATYLKYIHIGLFGTGELFYIYNAITGISMIPKDGKDTKIGELHRTVFFVHAGLLAAQLAMGVCMGLAVERGDTELVKNLGLAHAIVGVAFPVIELTSGIFPNFPDLLGK